VDVELADAAEVQTARPERRVVGLVRGQPAYRLLIAEDREGNRKLLVNLLAPIGFEVREAVNGQEAIQIWEQWQPHLIWMDLRMPVVDGYEATKRIKSTSQGQATVIVALTASAFEEDRAAILSQGCDDFVRKPFREGEIFDALARHLDVRFVYEEADVSPVVATPSITKDVLTPDALAPLPAEWVAQFREAATQLDADMILGLLDQIRDDHPALADGFATLVRDFRFDVILAATKAAEDGDGLHRYASDDQI
jgi:CheY-like chemotaxis protein